MIVIDGEDEEDGRMADRAKVSDLWGDYHRHASVRFQATRMQPNVRFSTWACSWSGHARHLYAVLTVRNFLRLNSGM